MFVTWAVWHGGRYARPMADPTRPDPSDEGGRTRSDPAHEARPLPGGAEQQGGGDSDGEAWAPGAEHPEDIASSGWEPPEPGAQPLGEVLDEDEEGAGETDEEPSRKRSITDGIPGLSPDNAGPGAAAFFDIDNTMIRGSSFAALAKGMADRDYFTTSEILEFTWKQLKYVLSGRENMEDIAQATENGLAFVKGRRPEEIRQLANEVYDETMVRRLWAGSLELVAAHRALGHEVWLVSATPVEVAEEIAARLDLTGGLGTRAEVADGVYTGRLDGPPLHGAAKVETIRALAEAHGLDLARSAAYSDSSNDIPMLSEVGFPVAVNPDGPLRAHARREGWPIRDYRIRGKDAVRRGVPAAAAAGVAVGVAVGVAKAAKAIRDGNA
jgi:HAD superfamily hydrolase (TIGR01490 family)